MRITHAPEVVRGQAKMTIRSPVVVWILSFFTLGIWAVVWTYQITHELTLSSGGQQRLVDQSQQEALGRSLRRR